MTINTAIYGAPETWGDSILTRGGFKWVNFTETAGAAPRLMDGAAQDKTPREQLIEKSVCTQALGSESVYSNIIVENNGVFYHNTFDWVPWFLSESDDIERNSQNNTSAIQKDVNNNAWKPYKASTYYWNYSDYCRPFAIWYHKKILCELVVGLTASANVNEPVYNYSIYEITPTILSQYPIAQYAMLVPYIDQSANDTPNRSEIASTSAAQFGVSVNVEYDIADIPEFKIDYACYKSMRNNRIPIWGIFGNVFNEGSGIFNICLCDEEDINVYDNGITCAREYTDSFKNYLIKQAACFGLFVRVDNASGLDNSTIPLDNNDIILGVLEDGIGHGEYTRGAANRTNAIWSWDNNQSSDYDPYMNPHSEYDTDSHFNNISIANFNKVWVTSYNEVSDLIKEVYKALQRKPTDVQTVDYSADSFLSTDPINGIISIRRYPVNVVPNDNTPVYMTIGNYTSDTVQARRYINAPNSQFIDFVFSRSKRFDEQFDGSFLDREPYTTAELYIPFCGTVPISVADYIGHTITVKLAIDYLSGSCTAYVLCDGTPLQSANGQIGIDVPVSGINAATVDSQLLNANLRLKESQRQQLGASTAFFTTPFSIFTGAMGGGKYGVASAAQGVGSLVSMGNNFESAFDNKEAAAYELHHIQTPFKSVSAGSPLTAAMGEHCCRLTIYRPILSSDYDPETYAKTIGFACLINGKVSDFSGLTMGTIDLSNVNCSDREKELIAAAFARGVIL